MTEPGERTPRVRRVQEEFREILAEEIQKLKDPRVGFVTVTRVKVTPDLRRAIVFYTVLGEEAARKSTRAGLRSARRHLRAAIGEQVRLRFLPEIEFEEDDTIAEVERVQELIRRVREDEEGRGSPD
jgi:ribosome-binding factor A